MEMLGKYEGHLLHYFLSSVKSWDLEGINGLPSISQHEGAGPGASLTQACSTWSHLIQPSCLQGASLGQEQRS